jgi:hypothetical protein
VSKDTTFCSKASTKLHHGCHQQLYHHLQQATSRFGWTLKAVLCISTTANSILLFIPATFNSAGLCQQAGQCKAHRGGGQWRHCTGTHVSTHLAAYIARQLSGWQAVVVVEVVSAAHASAINLTALLAALIPSCIATISYCQCQRFQGICAIWQRFLDGVLSAGCLALLLQPSSTPAAPAAADAAAVQCVMWRWCGC